MSHRLKVNPSPFPNLIEDGMWPPTLLEAVVSEFPSPMDKRWRRYGTGNEIKFEGPPAMWGPSTHNLFATFAEVTPVLSELFEIDDLTMETIGGGYHLIPPGGLLKRHVDFNRSPETGLYRRLNLLVYLNHDWTDDGGWLELGTPEGLDLTEVAPTFNRTVVFETSDHSWHGHPKPVHRWRFSVAAYYFAPTPPPGYEAEHSTVWHRP